MSAPETPDELQTRLGADYARWKSGDLGRCPWDIVNAWPDINALLARLTAAEAIVQRAETVIVGHGLEGDEHAYRTLQMILALRERPS